MADVGLKTLDPPWYSIQPQSVQKPVGPAPHKYNVPVMQLIYDRVIYHRPAWFSFTVPIVLVYVAWIYTTVKYDLWYLIEEGWPMSLTMIFGAFVAGSTTLGGGAVAFPVMTLVLKMESSTARDFSLCIQSIGMTAALWGIFYQRILVDMTSFVWCGIGGVLGVIFGLLYIAPYIPSDYTSMFFVSFWLSFAIALASTNRRTNRVVYKNLIYFSRMPVMKAGLIGVGIFGGIVTSLTGSGLDIVSFSFLTLLFSISEDCATPTTVSLMGVNTVVGVLAKSMIYGLETRATELVWFAFPVVVVMAPLGAYVASYLHRKMLALWVYCLCGLQFITAFIVLDLNWPIVLFGLGSLVIGRLLWWYVVYLSDNMPVFKRVVGTPRGRARTLSTKEEKTAGIYVPVSVVQNTQVQHHQQQHDDAVNNEVVLHPHDVEMGQMLRPTLHPTSSKSTIGIAVPAPSISPLPPAVMEGESSEDSDEVLRLPSSPLLTPTEITTNPSTFRYPDEDVPAEIMLPAIVPVIHLTRGAPFPSVDGITRI